ncbi:ribosome silencing factor [Gardnerella vaginalis]|uniref:ribosome silencing factor n=1 Tax=Gardnerella vaginalis TaxID=2702 RepID=UPI00255079A6|nr:ribosome silencing factor [Gardnerella vaginalis]MDK7259751.1 ribosome silencing factor [Gardnerella vaginalis]MDK8776726.1 ribosome silencing factor [Gardnerella vaginalis]
MAALESSVNAIRIAAAAADRLKATNIQAFDVSNLLGITDAMLVVSASNERQVLAVSEEIEKDLYLKDNKRKALSREGLELAQWILLDFGDFVVHIMHEEAREFYRLERLWNDCPAIDLQLPEHDESDAHGDDGDDGDDVQNGDQESER